MPLGILPLVDPRLLFAGFQLLHDAAKFLFCLLSDEAPKEAETPTTGVFKIKKWRTHAQAK